MYSIKELRQQKGWSQAELGRRFQTTKARETICRWEKGEVLPSATHLQELANILGVSAEKIILKK